MIPKKKQKLNICKIIKKVFSIPENEFPYIFGQRKTSLVAKRSSKVHFLLHFCVTYFSENDASYTSSTEYNASYILV